MDRIIKVTGIENTNKVKTPVTMAGPGANVGGSEQRNKEWS